MSNEKRLIDANALLAIYEKWIPQLSSPEDDGDRRGVETCVVVLKDAPTVDAVEVVHGRWELHGNDDDMGCSFFCSECGWNFDEDEIYDCSGVVKRELPKYCPYCGAKMDGDRQ